jgi:hypothetical protein
MCVNACKELGYADMESDVHDVHGDRFEFQGLPTGVFDIAPGVKGYRLPEGFSIEALVNRDVDDLVIQMAPARP